MLSRIAESLFWLGRYLERADDTARLLDVETHRLLEGPAGGEALASRALLAVMGLEERVEDTPSFAEVTMLLAYSGSQPSSIVSSMAHARESARGIRESIPSELWECLNATHLELAHQAAGAQRGPHAYFRFARFVRERVAMAGGIADATMARDDGWRFFVAGRAVERVDMTARLLNVRLTQPSRVSDWITTLRACSAYEAFLRAEQGGVSAFGAVEFLLLDRSCPRSAWSALSIALDCMAGLDSGRDRLGPTDEARRILGRARAALEYHGIAEFGDEVPAHLLELQAACASAGTAIAARYFQHEATLAWRREAEPTREAVGA